MKPTAAYRSLAQKSVDICSGKFMKLGILVLMILTLILVFKSHLLARHMTIFVEADYSKLIDINFEFTTVPGVHSHLTSPKILIAVPSTPGSFENRRTIRETWGKTGINSEISVLFFLGLTYDAADKKTLQREIELHDDIVQGNFLDTMHNVSYKHQMMFKYVVYHCTNTEFIIKANDYAFINTLNLAAFINQYKSKYNSTNILCKIITDAPVARAGTWAISEDEYKEETYPTYCTGHSIVYPAKTVYMLYIAAQESRYIWIDDAFFTGILPGIIGIKHTDISRLLIDNETKDRIVKDQNFSGQILPFLFAYPHIKSAEVRAIWNYIVRVTPKTSIINYL